MSLSESPAIHVFAVIPFSGFGSDDVLVVPSGQAYQLPSGELAMGERVLEAVVRIVEITTGAVVAPVRLVYVVEGVDDAVYFGVLCELGDALEEAADLGGEIASLASLGGRFEPMALREVLMEDLKSGFVRPVAHIVSGSGLGSTEISVNW